MTLAGLFLAASIAAQPALPLGDALQAALAQSPAVKQADLDLGRANVALQGAQAERFTYSADVNLADGYGANGLLSPGSSIVGNQIPTINATLAARVPLFTGFRLERTIDQAKASVDAGLANRDAARQAVIWDVTEAYWLARRAELREAIATDAVTKAATARDIVRKSKAIGDVGEGEADRAEVALLNQQGDQLAAQDTRQMARDRLATLLQRDLTGVVLQDPPGDAGGSVPAVGEAIATAMAHRPDVRIAQAQLGSADAAAAAAAADRWPQLALEGAYQHGNNPYDPVAQSRIVLDRLSGDAYARLNLTYHLFDQGTVARAIQQRELEAGGARQALVAARRAAELDVKQALARLAGAKRRVALGERSEAVARRNVAYMEKRFRFGYALLTELNEARQSLVSADLQHTDAEIDLALARAALARATGTLEAPTPLKQEH